MAFNEAITNNGKVDGLMSWQDITNRTKQVPKCHGQSYPIYKQLKLHIYRKNNGKLYMKTT